MGIAEELTSTLPGVLRVALREAITRGFVFAFVHLLSKKLRSVDTMCVAAIVKVDAPKQTKENIFH